MGEQHPLTRGYTVCPICLRAKERGIVVHWGRCYRESGVKDGTPEAVAVLDAFEAYLSAVGACSMATMWYTPREEGQHATVHSVRD